MNDQPPDSVPRPKWLNPVRLGILFLVIVSTLWGGWLFINPAARSAMSLEARLKQAEELASRGKFRAAEAILLPMYQEHQTLYRAGILAAECAAARGQHTQAAKLLGGISNEHLPISAMLLKATISHEKLFLPSDAILAYTELLEREPNHVAANEKLAQLMATVGLRRQAIPHILRLIQARVETDLLILLVRRQGGIQDADFLRSAADAAPADPLPRLGFAWTFAIQGETRHAINALQDLLKTNPNLVEAWGLLGEQYVQQADFDALQEWSQRVPSVAEIEPTIWLSRGVLAEHHNDSRGAIRCYWEAFIREPESLQAAFGLARTLASEGMHQEARYFAERIERMQALETVVNRVLFSSNSPGFQDLLLLIEQFQAADRHWEAYAWGGVAQQIDPGSRGLTALWGELQRATQGLPLTVTATLSLPVLPDDFFLAPYLRPTEGKSAELAKTEQTGNVVFESTGGEIGFDFRFVNGPAGDALRMYQLTGGGIGVLDYDVDGNPDLFCTQGGEFPHPLSAETPGDSLYRNLDGKSFVEVGRLSGIIEKDFGQGVAIGDLDNDGFEDLYVANIGENVIWMNNGDGTFSQSVQEHFVNEEKWTTSCLVADLNGDTLPDLYDVNYLQGSRIYEQTCLHPDGTSAMCMPFDFDAEVDQLWLSDGKGGFFNANDRLSFVPQGKGLGVLAWNADRSGRLSLLIANDTTPNFLYQQAPDATEFRLEERGILAGIALNESGKAEGSMGIALGDVNGDGMFEVHITIFWQSPTRCTLLLHPVSLKTRLAQRVCMPPPGTRLVSEPSFWMPIRMESSSCLSRMVTYKTCKSLGVRFVWNRNCFAGMDRNSFYKELLNREHILNRSGWDVPLPGSTGMETEKSILSWDILPIRRCC